MTGWRKYFPYDNPRDIQAEALDKLEANWNKYDIFIISAPTAFGKTALARTLIKQYHSVSVITPTNLLVEQFRNEFPDTPTLARLDSYWCAKWDRPCPITRAKLRNFCSLKRDDCKCPASHDLSTAKHRRGPGIYNYHTYSAHKIHREVLVIDEAHNVISFIKDRMSSLIWKHDYKYPNGFSFDKVREWLDTLPANKKKHKKIQLLKEAISSPVPTHVAQFSTEKFNGKGTRRGFPEDRDCIKLLPVDISDAPPILWPNEVKKVVLLSATIGRKDIEQLGIGRRGRKILYLDCKHPIPPENRPIVPLDTISVNYKSIQAGAVDVLAGEINNIADYHKGEKGVIHATYQLSGLLRGALTDSDRFMFHDRTNKGAVYKSFRDSDPRDGKVLIACGMYEGIDLPEDLGRWQVIAKIPWMSLGNPAIKHLSELDEAWYIWETLKTTIQAAGRICRTPTDFGTTYILDKTFRNLMEQAKYYGMIPEWFQQAIIEGDT